DSSGPSSSLLFVLLATRTLQKTSLALFLFAELSGHYLSPREKVPEGRMRGPRDRYGSVQTRAPLTPASRTLSQREREKRATPRPRAEPGTTAPAARTSSPARCRWRTPRPVPTRSGRPLESGGSRRGSARR